MAIIRRQVSCRELFTCHSVCILTIIICCRQQFQTYSCIHDINTRLTYDGRVPSTNLSVVKKSIIQESHYSVTFHQPLEDQITVKKHYASTYRVSVTSLLLRTRIYSQWKFFNGYIKLAVFCTTVKRLLCVCFCTVFETNSCVLSSTPFAKSCEEYMEWNKFCSIVHYLVHPSQRMLHPSIRKTKQWMLYRETKAGYSENHVIHIYTLCRQYAEFLVWNLAVCIQTTKLSKG
jgi:hypothetical protein